MKEDNSEWLVIVVIQTGRSCEVIDFNLFFLRKIKETEQEIWL